ncbi:hypothetical protein [Collinsella tanakaei]|uniref:hypothetical protein n=1 Tax=Collinsella tanakaei TaxID=626935 RepID=UPI0025A3AE0C|nr:hypothetical protein [Collinsella tanakaei]MDM8299657.1 hypothetical protein [Collinsella tanakaei]
MGDILDIIVPVGICIAAIVAAAIVYCIVVAVKSRRATKREQEAWREQRAGGKGRARDDADRR